MSKKNVNENRLFSAAIEEFTNNSYDDASLNNIIKNADISKGSFYYRFENKFALYLHLLKTCVRKKWEFINSAVENDTSVYADSDIFDMFLFQAEISVKFALQFPEYHQLNKMFAKEKGSLLHEDILSELGKSDEAGMEIMVGEAYKRGDFNKTFTQEFVLKVISFLFSSFDEVFYHDEKTSLEEIMKNLKDYVSFMRHGLSV